ncbi:MAG: glycosyltransferase family 4 protein [Candidatus Omnitrophota bacterium]
MNILFLSKDYPPYSIGGVGSYVYEMSRLLVRAGHKTFVITKAEDTPCTYVDGGVRVYRVKPVRYRFLNGARNSIGGFLERMEYSLAVSRQMKEVVKQDCIDIVETCEARAEAFWYYLFRRNPPLVIKLHTPETVAFKLDHTPTTLDYRLIKLLEEYWISRAQQHIGLSSEVVELTRRHFSLRLEDTPLMSNPIDIKVFCPSPNGMPVGVPEILYVGRLEFRKGVHTLMRALAYVQDCIPGARLTLIGSDCGMSQYVQEKIRQLKYPEQVKWIGEVSRQALPKYYQHSTVCVVPSLWENYPYVCLEAMACGKAVIASSVGGIKKIIRDDENGLLVPAGSSRNLAEAIVRVLNDSFLRSRLEKEARAFMEKEYTEDTLVGQAAGIYEKVLARQ